MTLLRDHIQALKRERDRVEATMLNQHIYKAAADRLQGDGLEDLRESTQEEYARLLQKELKPIQEYFETADEDLVGEIPLEDEEDPNFDYPGDYDWKEGDYMWLLFKIQQHFAHRDIWEGVYGFINRTQPHHRVSNQQAMINLMESWQEVFDKAIRVKRRAQNYLRDREEEVDEGERGRPRDQPPLDALIPPSVPTPDDQPGDQASQRIQGEGQLAPSPEPEVPGGCTRSCCGGSAKDNQLMLLYGIL